ncbi:hypothetical protein QN382_10770 [Pseudomonas sp. 10B1]|nr:hypothetical protein [Pseudomonas sp. AB12(2023)]MEB0309772.1 hypothetical protein [Pseudomonas sp. 10B1]
MTIMKIDINVGNFDVKSCTAWGATLRFDDKKRVEWPVVHRDFITRSLCFNHLPTLYYRYIMRLNTGEDSRFQVFDGDGVSGLGDRQK